MRFSFEVGEVEKHLVFFHFNQIWGNVEIQVDGRSVKDDFLLISFSLTKTWEFDLGVQERHHIQIDKIRPLFFAGFRPSVYRIYVDGSLIKETEG